MVAIRIVCSLALLAGFAMAGSVFPLSHAADEDVLKFKTEQVVVFKDGYCLVVKEGVATTDENGVAYTYDVPDAAVLGSFWAIPEDGEIKSMVAGWERTKNKEVERVNCADLPSIVEANVGRKCSFKIEDETLKGTILKLLQNDAEEPTLEDVPPTAAMLSSVSPFGAAGNEATNFILRSRLGDTVVKISDVQNLTIEGMVSEIDKTTVDVERKKKLSLKFDQKNQAVKIKLMYFRPDVRWIPTYRIELTDDPFKGDDADRKTAEIMMQGEIINDAEDLVDVPFHVVVGVPNFRFRGTASPMVLEAQMRSALINAAPQMLNSFDNNRLSNAAFTQQSSRAGNSAGVADGSDTINVPAELNGKASQDLFVYELEPLTLKKGERASVPILTTSVGYRDVYTWDIQIKHSENFVGAAGKGSSPLVLSENKVWRQIELINDTGFPWTTGAAMFMDGFQPLAQELLTYTSPGGTCRIPVTVAVDLRGTANDEEVSRELNAVQWRHNAYSRVKGKITAGLTNNKKVKVPVEVSIRFGGKATKASNDGKIELSAFNKQDWENTGDAINNSCTVRWKSEIEPRGKFEPAIEYEFLLRN